MSDVCGCISFMWWLDDGVYRVLPRLWSYRFTPVRQGGWPTAEGVAMPTRHLLVAGSVLVTVWHLRAPFPGDNYVALRWVLIMAL